MTDINILNGFKKGLEKTRDEIEEKLNIVNQEIKKLDDEINEITTT